jgi:menaquinone-dependent protoporphyrinogen oxidase
MTVLVAYASKHGSTEGIARAIADRLNELGVSADVQTVGDVDGLAALDAVVLGSAVYAGSWMKEAVEFVHRHAEPLAERPVWLFSSGPLGEEVEDDEEQPRQLPELRGLIGPIEHRIFFGALDRSKLGFGERMMVKAVKAPDGDFRDWDTIRAWADGIAAELRARAKET